MTVKPVYQASEFWPLMTVVSLLTPDRAGARMEMADQARHDDVSTCLERVFPLIRDEPKKMADRCRPKGEEGWAVPPCFQHQARPRR